MRSRNHCCRGKAISTPIAYSECVSVVLVIQHARIMPCIILPYIACPALPLLSTLSHKRHDISFKKKGGYWTQNVCFEFRYNFWMKHFSLRTVQCDIITNVHRSSCTVTRCYCCFVVCLLLLLSGFNKTWIFFTNFRNNTQIPNFMKIRPVVA